jgi:hypothetical protein
MNQEFKSADQIPVHAREHPQQGVTLPHTGAVFKNAVSETSNEVLKNVR